MFDIRVFGPEYHEVIQSLRDHIKQGRVYRLWYEFPLIRVQSESRDVVQTLVDDFGHGVVSIDGRPLEAVVGDRLREKGLTLATAESCTGGLIGHMITNVPGSSDYFMFGAVVYSNEAKNKILGVKKETLDKFGAVSEQTVREMLDGVCRISGVDCAVAVSGIAGPTGGTPQKPVGTVYIGVRVRDDVSVKLFHFQRDREGNKVLSAYNALFLLDDLIEKVE